MDPWLRHAYTTIKQADILGLLLRAARRNAAHLPNLSFQISKCTLHNKLFTYRRRALHREAECRILAGGGKTWYDGTYDVAIIGGGINGCGIARDAAGRGLSVYLCQRSDLASGTSSAATKLIHGGLRYLEYLEFRLVREALMEREVLWRMAPHIIWPLRFVLPYHEGLRPAWLLRARPLFLYDHLGRDQLLPPTTTLDLTKDITGRPLRPVPVLASASNIRTARGRRCPPGRAQRP